MNLDGPSAKLKLGNNFPVQELLDWFVAFKRDLPWRKNPSFYEVLVSEFMLQQTGVQTVIPYYILWMKTFPTLWHLAQSDIKDVIKIWEGLGYYSRARNLHQMAHFLEKKAFKLPSNFAELREIKGIGDYTANAILAFAYQKPVIAIDGNVLRVGARFWGIQEDIKSIVIKKRLQNLFDAIEKQDGVMAEALIELGALICRKKPDCESCPLKLKCKSYKEQLTDKIPLKTEKKSAEKLYSKVVVLEFQNRILVKKQRGNLMKDLYEFPHENEIQIPTDYLISEQPLQQIKRTFTRFIETLYPTVKKIHTQIYIENLEWVDFYTLQVLPFSSGHRKIKELILAKAKSENSSY